MTKCHVNTMNFNKPQMVKRMPAHGGVKKIPLDLGAEDIATKLVEERNKNEEIKRQLTLEKARADRLQKKVQFIQDNQDLFNQLKDQYSTLKLTKENIVKIESPTVHTKVQVGRELQDCASQTTTIELLKNAQVTAVNKKDLAEVTQLIKELKQVVIQGGKRVYAALENDHARDVEDRKKVEIENLQLKRELFHKSSELERLRSSAGSGPREVTLLRRIITKMINGGNDITCLSSREASLARYLAKKYEYKYSEDDRRTLNPAVEQEEEHTRLVSAVTASDSLESMPSPYYQTPRTLHTPKSPEYSTPRWNRAEDVP